MMLLALLISSGVAVENVNFIPSPLTIGAANNQSESEGKCNQHNHFLPQCHMSMDDCSQTLILFSHNSTLVFSNQVSPVPSLLSYYYRIPYGKKRPPKSILV